MRRLKHQVFYDGRRRCIGCLYRTGFGFSRISWLMDCDKNVVSKAVKRSGVFSDERQLDHKNRVHQMKLNRLATIQANKPPKRRKQTEDEKRLKWKKRYQDNRAMYLEKAKLYIYSKEQKLKRAEHAKEWRRINPEKHSELNKKWRKNNPEKCKRLKRLAGLKPKNKIVKNLRRRLRDFLKNNERPLSGLSLFGCNRTALVKWIESKWSKRMSWENYGQWHIDHIVPCASFDLTNKDQQRKCFHYSNLRPLWAKENMMKSDSIVTTQPELCLVLA